MSAVAPIEVLLELMRQLRDPRSGCPWDQAQDYASIAPHTIEEAYEVADAIARSDLAALRDELGDLLFQVVFLSQLAAEQGAFDFNDVANAISAKLVRRHPHVFAGQSVPASELSGAWERHKAGERAARGQAGALAGVALALPALIRAQKLGKRAAAVGFDWRDPEGVYAKLREEIAEFVAAVQSQDTSAMEEELGDVLFSVVNLARFHALDAEVALRRVNRKFELRFARMEALARQRGLDPRSRIDIEVWEELWQLAKRADGPDDRGEQS